MALSLEDIAAVVRELAPALTGGWIQKIHQPAPLAISLEVRVPRQTLILHLSADPDMARLHLITGRLPNPAVPPAFCQFLRAHIQGARLEAVEQVPDERIVRLRLFTRDGPCSLIAELTGRSANLYLVDGAERVLAALAEGRHKVGELYTLPVMRPEPHRAMSRRWHTLTPDQPGPFPISAALEQRYCRREEELALERARHARLAALRKAIKKAARRVDGLQADLEKAAGYKDHARYGELLKANLGRMTKGQEKITVVDYFDPTLPELTIPLDPAKTPRANMDDYFKKHRKFLAVEREIRPRLETAQKELEKLKAERSAIEHGEWTPTPGAPGPTGPRKGASPAPRERKEQARSGPYRKFLSADGLPIYVGRNARENEELTHKFARSDDLWLHARGTPGSHVVVRLEKGTDPPPDTLKDAATLALLYSDLKKSGKGEVIYTRKKWVRKAKGQAPGTVHVTQEKSLYVTLDRVRLDRLKESS